MPDIPLNSQYAISSSLTSGTNLIFGYLTQSIKSNSSIISILLLGRLVKLSIYLIIKHLQRRAPPGGVSH